MIIIGLATKRRFQIQTQILQITTVIWWWTRPSSIITVTILYNRQRIRQNFGHIAKQTTAIKKKKKKRKKETLHSNRETLQ